MKKALTIFLFGLLALAAFADRRGQLMEQRGGTAGGGGGGCGTNMCLCPAALWTNYPASVSLPGFDAFLVANGSPAIGVMPWDENGTQDSTSGFPNNYISYAAYLSPSFHLPLGFVTSDNQTCAYWATHGMVFTATLGFGNDDFFYAYTKTNAVGDFDIRGVYTFVSQDGGPAGPATVTVTSP